MLTKLLLKYIPLSVLKGVIAAFFTMIGLSLGGMATAGLGIAAPVIPVNADQQLILILYTVVYFFAALIVGELFSRLNQNYFERVACIFMLNYLVQGFLQVLEQIIFTNMTSLEFGLIFNLFPSVFFSIIVALLWRSKSKENTVIKQLNAFFARKVTKSWVWRLFAAWLAYIPIYYLIGMSVSPFVKEYYLDQSLNLGLVLPDWKVIVGMQFIRGFFYLLSALPIIILWKKSSTGLWLWIGAAIFIQVASLMLLSYWLPVSLRIPHAIELTVDSFLQAYVYVKLLYVEKKVNIESVNNLNL